MTSNNKIVVPEAKAAMEKFKMEAANEVGVNLKQGYNGDLTSREAGSVGGQMVKKMIEAYENSIKISFLFAYEKEYAKGILLFLSTAFCCEFSGETALFFVLKQVSAATVDSHNQGKIFEF